MGKLLSRTGSTFVIFGHIISDESCTTRTPGVYAAGDCRTKSIRQIVTAAGDGAVAALAACRYLEQ